MSNPPPSVSIDSISRIGYIELSFNVVAAPGPIDRLVTITNDNRASASGDPSTVIAQRSMIETSHSILDSAGQPVTKLILDSSIAPIGISTFVTLLVYFKDVANTVLSSNTIAVISRNVPIKPPDSPSPPALPIFRETDKGLSMNIGVVYTSRLSEADGYTNISKVIVYISKVGSKLPTDFITKELELPYTMDANNEKVSVYDSPLVVADNLENSKPYEVAFRVVNTLGQSPLSKTYILTPKDFPAQLAPPFVYTLFGNQSRLGLPLADERGDVVVYFRQPSDYDDLIISQKPVTSYTLSESYTSGTSTVVNKYTLNVGTGGSPGTAVVTTGPAVALNFTLATDHEYNATTVTGYHYKLIIQGNSNRLGTLYTYKIYASNGNGDSLDSIYATNTDIRPFILPSSQTAANCTLLHTDASGTTLNGGLSFRVYTGDMTMRITELSNINNGAIYSDGSGNPIYKLRVTDFTTTAELYSGEVTFIRSGAGTGLSPYIYNLDFANVTKLVATVSTSLNLLLAKGTKYNFALHRLSKNPNNASMILESVPLVIARTPFSSPGMINNCEAYSYNDDLTPVTSGTNPALRILFSRLQEAELNAVGLTSAITGTANSGAQMAIVYMAFQNSQPVFLDTSGNRVAEGTANAISVVKSHYTAGGVPSNDPYEFIVPLAALGTVTNNYIRVKIWNSELGAYINAAESSPAFSEMALSFVEKPSNVVITKTSSTSITVTFDKQSNTQMKGNITTNINNRVVLVSDATNSRVGVDQLVAHSAVDSPSVSFSELSTTTAYRVYVIAETYYSRRQYNSVTNGVINDDIKRFNNVVIRNQTTSVESKSFVMTGIPTSPTNLEFFASDKSITAYYDAPLSTHGITDLYYHIYAYRSTVSLPSSSTQISIANSQGTASITIDKAINSTGASITTDIINNTTYNAYMRVIGKIASRALTNSPFSHSYTDGLVNGSAVTSSISLSNTVVTIPEETNVLGDLSTAFKVVPDSVVPTPSSVTVTSQNSKLVVSLRKDIITVQDLIITVNDSDATTDLSGNIVPVASFDTRLARLYNNGVITETGLFSVEGKKSWVPSLFEAFDLTVKPVSVSNGQTTEQVDFYNVSFAGLTSGKLYTFSVRYSKANGDGDDTFSAPVVVSGSSESSPTLINPTSFSVADKSITVKWLRPTNSGRVGETLYYNVIIATLNESGAIVTSSNTTPTFDPAPPLPGTPAYLDTVNPYVFTYTASNLTNYTNYVISVEAYYFKNSINAADGIVSSSPKNINPNNNGRIKPRPAPVGATIQTSFASNSITYTIAPPTTVESADYPITNAILYIQYDGVPSTKTALRTILDAEYVNAHLIGSHITDTLTNIAGLSSINSNFTHIKPVNAFKYILSLEYTPNYADAQNIPGTSTSVTPYGPVIIESVSSSGNAVTAVVNLNGSGNLSNIIGLAKESGTNNVLAVTAGTVTTLAGGATDSVAAGEKRSVVLTYPGIASISDSLTVVATSTSSDTLTNSSTFFTQ